MDVVAVKQAIDTGAVIPLDPYLEEYAPNYWELLQKDPELKKQMTAPDGHIYTFVRYNNTSNYKTPHKLWINEQWLKDAGLSMPTTLAELEEVLTYFRDNDMNGNGETDDENPMVGCQGFSHEGADPSVAIVDCFEVVTDNYLKADENQNISCMAITDAYREGLSYCNKLYEDGLISVETYTQDLAWLKDYCSVVTDDQVKVGVTGGPEFNRWVTPAYPNAYTNYTYIPPLKKDEKSDPQTLYVPRNYDPMMMVTSKCENPEEAVKWIDTYLEPELQIISAFGWEDEHWKRLSESEETGIVFEMTGKSLYEEGKQTTNQTYSDNWYEVPTYQGDLYKPFTIQYAETDVKKIKELEATNLYVECSEKDGLPHGNMWVVDPDVEIEYNELFTDMKNYILQSYAEFITGVRDIDDDAAWNAYIDELNARGLGRYIEVAGQYFYGE